MGYLQQSQWQLTNRQRPGDHIITNAIFVLKTRNTANACTKNFFLEFDHAVIQSARHGKPTSQRLTASGKARLCRTGGFFFVHF
jgi:hypothetical protein